MVITSSQVIGQIAKTGTDLDAPIQDLFELDRPFVEDPDANNMRRKAEVVDWNSRPAAIAILRIKGFSYAATISRPDLTATRPLNASAVETYGYQQDSATAPTFTKIDAQFISEAPNILIQWDSASYPADLVCSGSLVWSKTTDRVIGIIISVERNAQYSVATVMPTEQLLAAFFDLYPDYQHDDLAKQRAFREELIRGLEFVGEYKNNISRYFDNYLGTSKLPVPFGGRKDVLDKLDVWLASDVHYRLLAAPAGRGKSSVAVHWVLSLVQRQPQLKIIFLPISIRFATSSSAVALSSLLARLRVFFPNISISPSQSVDEFKRSFVDVLESLRHDADDQYLLVLDGIDESMADWVDQSILPADPPDNLHVLLTARFTPEFPDADAWLRQLGWDRADWDRQNVFMSLPLLTQEGLGEVLASSQIKTERLRENDALIEQLFRLSEGGDPLLASLYIQVLHAGRDASDSITAEMLNALAPGYQGFMDFWLAAQESLWQKQYDKPFPAEQLETIFGLLAKALYPLERGDIETLMDALGYTDREEIGRLLSVAARLVIRNQSDDSYTFTHRKLTEFFLNKRVIGTRAIEDYEQVFLNWGQRVIRALNQGKLRIDCSAGKS